MTGFHQFSVGDFTCITLNDGTMTRPASTFFVGADEAILEAELAKYNHTLEAVSTSFNPLYIDTGTHKVLVDTGNGRTDDPNRGKMFQRMADAGIDPSDITMVITTHAHGDHILGNAKEDGSPEFPNAQYVIGKTEWEHWTSAETLAQMGERSIVIERNLIGLKDSYRQVINLEEIVPGITAMDAFGHSPGHIALLIKSGEATMLHVADAIHQPLHADFPDWGPRFDAQPVLATATRRHLFKFLAENNWLMYGFHFPFPGTARVTSNGDVWKCESVELG